MKVEKLLFLIISLIYFPTTLFSQGGGPPPPGLPDPPAANIDKEIIILFVAGVLFGVFVVIKKKS